MNKKGLTLIFLTAVISGFSVFINKYGVSFSDPYVFTFIKNIIVALFLSSLFWAKKDFSALRQLGKKDWLLLLAIGLVGGSIPFLFFFKGLKLTSAAQGAFVHKSMFIWTAVLAGLFLKEKISRNFAVGGLLIFLGNMLALKTLNFSFGKGDLLIFLATIFWAVENIISKRALAKFDGKTVAWGRMFFGSFFILLFLAVSGQLKNVWEINLLQIGWAGLTSVLLFGYVITWYSGLRYIPVSVATSILVLGSVVTTGLSMISAGKINSWEITASFFVISGVFLVALSGGMLKNIYGRKEKYIGS